LTLPVLRHVADQLRHIDDLNVPFHRGELPRHQHNANQAAHAHRQALAARDTVRATRDRTNVELQALNPWNPFTGRRRTELETLNRAANRQLVVARHEVETTGADLDRANQRLDHARQWLDRHEPDFDQRSGLVAALSCDLTARTLNAATSPTAAWAELTLGPRPDHQPTEAAVWDLAVAAIGQYRDIWQITDADHPLGARPRRYDNSRRHDWQQAAGTLIGAAQQLGRQHQLDTQLSHDLGLDSDRSIGISR
jgi:hypothetical protein